MINAELFHKLREVIINIINDFKNSDVIAIVGVIVSLCFTIISALLALYYVIIAVVTVSHNSVVTNIVNEDSLDYKVSKTFNVFLASGFNYKYFLILPLLQLLPLIAIIVTNVIRKRKTPPGTFEMGTSVVILMCVLFVQGIISLVLNYIFYFSASKGLTPINKRIKSFNSYVYSRMYKGAQIMDIQTTFKFYSVLSEVQSNPFALQYPAKTALGSLPSNINAETLARAFFTINMYMHFHKLGVRNSSTYRAMSLFSPIVLLMPSLYSPADFLFKRGTFIEDVSDKLGSPTAGYLSPDILKDTNLVNQAIALNAEWIAEANNRGNSIYAEDATIPFFIMAIMILMIQIVSVCVLAYIFSDPDRREAFISLLVR